jgi:acyl-CoA synthetase (AMP-forming)/AMP-acid ligase II
MAGYWQRPDETEVMTPDGYFKSGDIGIIDENGFQDHRPQEGHGAGQRLQCLSKRD